MTSVKKRLYLASQSPRRASLLDQIGVGFELISVDVDETTREGEKGVAYVERLALAKAEAGWNQLLPTQIALPVLGADTCVVLDGKIMGKPKGRSGALAMLRSLSAKTHQVITGICLKYEQQCYSTVTVTHVIFRAITEHEVNEYCESSEPLDKAGSYAIQGKGAVFVEQIYGSYSGVVGLPLAQTYQLLKQIEQEYQL